MLFSFTYEKIEQFSAELSSQNWKLISSTTYGCSGHPHHQFFFNLKNLIFF